MENKEKPRWVLYSKNMANFEAFRKEGLFIILKPLTSDRVV